MAMIKETLNCGCMVTVDYNNMVQVDYCPKHKAAPDMYEALVDALDFIEVCGNESHISGDSDNCSHCLIKKNATLALAKARGK